MFDLTPYNTFGLHVSAAAGRIIRHARDLDDLGDLRSSLILGVGSDILLTEDYRGTVLIDAIRHLTVTERVDGYEVEVGSGVILDELIARLTERGIPGLENLSGIPGTLGAAPVQNIGAYGVEIGEFVQGVRFRDLETRQDARFERAQCEFCYRSSYFKRQRERRLFITAVELRLPKTFTPRLSYPGLQGMTFASPAQLRTQILTMRGQKLPDPRQVGNAGSFFKNPVVSAADVRRLRAQHPDLPGYPQPDGAVKLSAGWLIDRAGCRGITHGRAGTWERQALVIVNRGEARPHEILALARYVASEVDAKFGIKLEPEVRLYGADGEIPWN